MWGCFHYDSIVPLRSLYWRRYGTLKIFKVSTACLNSTRDSSCARQGLVWHRSLAFYKNEMRCESKARFQTHTATENLKFEPEWDFNIFHTCRWTQGIPQLANVFAHDTRPTGVRTGIVHLYFGCRNEGDFLHKSQLETLEHPQDGS